MSSHPSSLCLCPVGGQLFVRSLSVGMLIACSSVLSSTAQEPILAKIQRLASRTEVFVYNSSMPRPKRISAFGPNGNGDMGGEAGGGMDMMGSSGGYGMSSGGGGMGMGGSEGGMGYPGGAGMGMDGGMGGAMGGGVTGMASGISVSGLNPNPVTIRILVNFYSPQDPVIPKMVCRMILPFAVDDELPGTEGSISNLFPSNEENTANSNLPENENLASVKLDTKFANAQIAAWNKRGHSLALFMANELETVEEIIRTQVSREFATLLLRAAPNSEQVSSDEKSLREILQREYDALLTKQRMDLSRVQEKLKQLQTEVDRRAKARDRVVEVQLGKIVLETQGLLRSSDESK